MEMQSYSDLPEDVAFDILSRLPAKSVGQCRCVSKQWKYILYRPEFIKAHLQLSRIVPHESLILYSYSQRSLFSASMSDACHLFGKSAISKAKLPYPFTTYSHGYFWVKGSCDGLVLLRDVRQCFVKNPITREIKVIPLLFPFDRQVDIVCHGLGYDSVSHDYKVVSLRQCPEEDSLLVGMCVDVYSLRRGSWKIGSSILPYKAAHRTSGVFVNGCIHWTVVTNVDSKLAILAFNTVEEGLRLLPLPSSDDGRTSVCHPAMLCGVGGCLCMFRGGESGRETDAWVMKQYGIQESWTKVASFHNAAYNIMPVGLSRQDEVVLNENSSKRTLYNLKQGRVKDVVVVDPLDGFIPLASFVESLISPCNSEAW